MIRLIAEAYLGLTATLQALTYRKGWQERLDVSLTGFWHSFLAIIPSTALVALIFIAIGHAGYQPPSLGTWISYGLSWLIFPGAAAVATIVLGVRQSFVPWVILHNWGVVWLYAFLALMWMLLTAGLINREFLEFVLFLYLYFRVLVHWRIAYVTLGLPTITSALAAAVPIVTAEIGQLLVRQAFGS